MSFTYLVTVLAQVPQSPPTPQESAGEWVLGFGLAGGILLTFLLVIAVLVASMLAVSWWRDHKTKQREIQPTA